MSTQDKPITTPAAMRAAAEIRKIRGCGGHSVTLRADRELATIIDQQTHLPELVDACEVILKAAGYENHNAIMRVCANELRSVLEKVKG